MAKNTGRGSSAATAMGGRRIPIGDRDDSIEFMATEPMPPRMTMSWTVNAQNRPAAELLFDICLVCRERRRGCSCHERGYN